MSNERRILLNTTMLGAGNGIAQVANFFLVVSFAHAFGAAALGHYFVAMAVGAVSALFVSLGTQTWLIREISRDPSQAREAVGVLLPAHLLLGLVAWAAACTVSLLLIGDAAAVPVVVGVCGYHVLQRMASLLLAEFQGRELMLVSATGDVAHRVLILLLALAAIALGATAGTVAFTMVVGVLVLIGYAWIQVSRNFGPPKVRFAPAEAMELFRRGAPFFGVRALSVLYGRGGPIILSALVAIDTVALYTVADRLMVAASVGPMMFNTAVYPALARVAHRSIAEAQALVTRCARLVLVGAIPTAALMTIFASDLVMAFFGTQYLGATPALQVLAWTLPIRGVQGLLGSQLSAMDQQAQLARARFVGLTAFLVACPVLILGFGYVGAAWAVLVCDAIQLGLYWKLVRRARAAPALLAAFLAPGIAVAVTLFVSTRIVERGLPWRLTVVTLVLTAGMLAFRAVRAHDIRFLRATIAGKTASSPAEP